MKSQKSRLKKNMLKQIRNRLGLSQEDLARLLDVSVFQVSRWENGKARFALTLRQFKKLLELLQNLGLGLDSLPDDISEELPFCKVLTKTLDKTAS